MYHLHCVSVAASVNQPKGFALIKIYFVFYILHANALVCITACVCVRVHLKSCVFMPTLKCQQ